MSRLYFVLTLLLFLLPVSQFAQTVNISDYDNEDNRDINFDIIGKMNNNILVYKNIRSKHKINIFGPDMSTLQTVRLDFVPANTFNIDFVAYPDFFYMIYQYQKGNILHCMAVKMNANVQKMGEPFEIDTTRIPILSDNKIYTTVYSEDRKKIMIFKIQTRFQKLKLSSLLFDDHMKLINRGSYLTEYLDRRETYNNFLIDNDGNFIFTYTRQSNYRDYNNSLALITKSPLADTFAYYNIDLDEKYLDEVKLKIDNRNKRYIFNSFYYKKNRVGIEGLFCYVWDKSTEKAFASQFTELYDSVRYEATSGGLLRFAFDDFFIRHVIVKADGGFILAAEEYTNDSRGSNFSRNDYLYNPYFSPSGTYYYNPYTGYYRPLSSYGNQVTVRYYYNNILVASFSKKGELEWTKIIHKSQYEDNDENSLSFSTLITGSEIHFLFNQDRKYEIVSDQIITPDGTLVRYPTLKSEQKGYEFMPALGKQVGSRQIIIPCAYRNNICFAKVEF